MTTPTKEKLEAKAAKLRDQLAQATRRLQQIDSKETTRKKILVGAVVLKKAEGDPAFAAKLQAWLDEGLTQNRDRVVFGLAEKVAPMAENNDIPTFVKKG